MNAGRADQGRLSLDGIDKDVKLLPSASCRPEHARIRGVVAFDSLPAQLQCLRWLHFLASNAGQSEVLENGICVVSLIRTERSRLQIQQQRQGFRAIAGFTSREAESGERPQTFNQGVYLGTQSAPRPPECLSPFFVGRSRRMLVSTNNGAVDERLLEIRILRQMSEDSMPYASPRPTGKALLFHGPNCRRRSRQGLPVRAIHSTASTNSRLSPAVRPGSLAFPGNNAAIRSN